MLPLLHLISLNHGIFVVAKSCHTCDIALGVQHLNHPASTLLHHCKKCRVPLITNTVQWPIAKLNSAINRGPHKLAGKEWMSVRQGLPAMMRKGQWTVLPASLARKLEGEDKSSWNRTPA
jgi:hypothetical protein